VSATCRERGEQRLLFVLDGLDAPARVEFERHLVECERCAGAVAAAREALEEEESPPLSEAADASLERARARLAERIREAGRPAPSPARAGWLRSALAAALAAALAGGAVWLAQRRALAGLEESNRALEQRVALLGDEQATLSTQNGELRQHLSQALRALDLLRADDLVVVQMTAAAADSAAKARIFWHPKTFRCYLSAHGLPRLGGERRYALWVFTGAGDTILVGSFDTDADGAGALYAELPDGTTGITRVVLTDEAEAAGASPSGPEHLVWLRPS
jgi:hypothetical protein